MFTRLRSRITLRCFCISEGQVHGLGDCGVSVLAIGQDLVTHLSRSQTQDVSSQGGA